MKERIEQFSATMKPEIYISVLFTPCLHAYLRAEAAPHWLSQAILPFTIQMTAKSVVKTVINELNLDDKHYKPNIVYNRISAAKNALVGPEEYANDYYLQQEDTRANRPAIGQIYEA